MEGVILVLFLALTFVLIGILICGFYRVRGEILELEADAEKIDSCARAIIIKQAAGEMKISYIVEPKLIPREELKSQVSRDEVAEAEGVLIRPSEKLTFREKYEQLPKRAKSLLDEFTDYLVMKPDCEQHMQTNALLYRYKKGAIAKAIIRRDTVILRLNVPNPKFGRMVREEKLKSVTVDSAEVRLTGETELELAKQTADITLSYLQEEEKYKLEQRKTARREAARAKRNEEVSK